MQLQVFLSCSFASADTDVVNFFMAVCRGLDIRCVNVSKGDVRTPPDKAREMIRDAQLLIAVATRRDQISPKRYSMPKAVEEELSMAYAIKVPILLFAETEVDTTTGFIRNYCTFQEFDRKVLLTPDFVEKAVACIHGAKLDVISPQQLQLAQQGQAHLHAERTRSLLELVDLGSSFTWRYSLSRTLRFSERFTEPIKACAWAAVKTNETASGDVFKFSYTVDEGTKNFRIKAVEEKHTCDYCQYALEVDPKPEANDTLAYSTVFESPYLNPLYIEDLADTHPNVTIDGSKYLCYDGIVPIIRTQELKVQIRFPPSFSLRGKDFVPFVGSYTNKVDYIVQSEIKRMKVTCEQFGGQTVLELKVESPLLQHVYGFAWNPPRRHCDVIQVENLASSGESSMVTS